MVFIKAYFQRNYNTEMIINTKDVDTHSLFQELTKEQIEHIRERMYLIQAEIHNLLKDKPRKIG